MSDPTEERTQPVPRSGDSAPARGHEKPPVSDWREGLTGKLLLDRYRIGARLGSGGMGSVYQATDTLKQRGGEEAEIAIKVIDAARIRGNLNALIHELSRSHQISHPNVLRVHDIHEGGGLAFITMELLRGETLLQRMEEARRSGAGVPLLPVDEVDRIAQALCLALSHCHERKLVHADIKPANIFLCADGTAKLLDLGIAQVIGRQGGIRGYSEQYASPQQIAGDLADPSDDLFSLSCTLYECLTGEHPFQRESAQTAYANRYRVDASVLPRRYRRALAAGLAYQAKERPRSAMRLWSRISPAVRRRNALIAGLAALVLSGFAVANLIGAEHGRSQTVPEADRSAAERSFEAAIAESDPGEARRLLLETLALDPNRDDAAERIADSVRSAQPADAASYSLAWQNYAAAIEASPTSEPLLELARERIDEILASDPRGLPRSEVLSGYRAPLCVLPAVNYRNAELGRMRDELRIRC
jgi:hypothetical protein